MAKLPEWRIIINDTKQHKWINEGRFTLFRNNEGNLMILIRELNIQDAGRYQIGLDNQPIIDMTLNVEEDLCCKVSKTVMVNSEETANFSCEYSQNHINNSKIIFKQGKDSVEEMIHMSTSSVIGRFSGYDCRNKKLIILRITAVTPDDGGVYLCGVWIYRHSYSYSFINTVHLHIITKVGVSRVSGYSGGGLMIKCEHPQYKTKPKYICKESDGCSERKNPGVQDEWMENGVSLYDILMVFFMMQMLEHTGVEFLHDHYYQCVCDSAADRWIHSDCVENKTQETRWHLHTPQFSLLHSYPQSPLMGSCMLLSVSRSMKSLSVMLQSISVRMRFTDHEQAWDIVCWFLPPSSQNYELSSGDSLDQSSLPILGAVKDIDVTGYSGGSVLVDSGKLWFSDSVKNMFKLPEWKPIINDNKRDKWINEGRFTMFRNNVGNLMIYIRDLNQQDAGRYRIRHHGQWSIDMTLNVKDDSCCKGSKRVMVNIGESANFSCEYSQNHINDPKIIFKEEKDSIETIYSRLKMNRRFSISDDKHKNIFSVRITAVTPDDGGVYLCGVWINRQSYSYSVINTVHLHIMDSCCGESKTVRVNSGETSAFSCEYSEDQRYFKKIIFRTRNNITDEVISTNDKLYQKERLSIYDNKQKDFSVRITAVTPDDGGVYLCALFISNEQLYWLLPPSPLTEYHINHTERAPPSGGYSV
ncbi:CMRF35-like molecule 8 [Labeo rohita]|uniref:CMRF35-like molecule 8 n=1 Tax=Labeo rohita TaxID=84645 RepID=A0ABQ8L8L5_LABRO|nr:CMRF35-like molecule 8 [Labeo rohita]